MTNVKGTNGNDSWTVVSPVTVTIDGLGGIDTLHLGTSARFEYSIFQLADGGIQVDSISGASGSGGLHATLYNVERLAFESDTDIVDLRTLFVDTTPPVVVNFSPNQQANDVAVGANIVFTFSEAILRGTGIITLKTAEGNLVASYNAANSSNLSFSGSTLAIDPSADLQFNQTYKIEIAAGSVIDLKGNVYAGTNNYSFTTLAPSVINGSNNNDTLLGSNGNDSINALGGNDTITGNAGDDNINGGDGLDTAIYVGKRAEYLVTAQNSNFSVQDLFTRDGTDTLSQVERLLFSDVALALDINGVSGQAYRIYQAAFDRKPDLIGLGYWINAMDKLGFNITMVAASFFEQVEFKTLYGDNPDTSTLVNTLYHNVLHREPEKAGFDFWVKALNDGIISRAGVLASFCDSPENQALVIGSIQNGIDYTLWQG
ncbi:MAG: DUF4214 domain-containing protein [Undibacterium sp.]|nr:DUF4214 domain-containing protein [Undibacterium sp.]